jgi:hypothetical protein
LVISYWLSLGFYFLFVLGERSTIRAILFSLISIFRVFFSFFFLFSLFRRSVIFLLMRCVQSRPTPSSSRGQLLGFCCVNCEKLVIILKRLIFPWATGNLFTYLFMYCDEQDASGANL